MKKILSILLCFILVFSMGGVSFFPASALTSGDYTYTVTSSKATITKYTGSGGAVVIPNTIGIYSVTSIGKSAFYNCRGLTSITIPTSVTSIGDYAFYDCTGLTSITIPSSVTSIGEVAFGNCTGLTNITIPSSVTSIGWCTFVNCSGLTSITIPSSVTNIFEAAFDGCTGLTSIIIPSSVTSIRYRTFSGCTALTSIIIPSSITNIGDMAFYGCTRLTSIIIPSSVTSIGNFAFLGCMGLTDIIIPSSLNSIGDRAFEDCVGLTSVTIPSSVTSIGWRAFSGCRGLNTAYFLGNAPTIGSEVFTNCAPAFKVYYISGKTGFTNPWYEYETATFNPSILAPTGLTSSSKTDKTVSLSWTAVLGATGYNVYTGATLLTATPITATTYTAAGLTGNTTYSFNVKAVNSEGESTPSAALNVKTNVTPPLAPTGLVSPNKTETTVNLSWSAVSGATGYDVYRNITKLTATPITATTYVATSLKASTAYSFTVKAVNAAGESPASSALNVTTNAIAPPPVPTGLTAVSASYNSVKLTWKAVVKSGYTVYYTVYRYNGSAYVSVTSLSAVSYINPSLATGTKYIYKVSAYIIVNGSKLYVNGSKLYGGQTGYVSAVPSLGLPSSFTATRYSSSSIKLSFAAVTGASGYEIYRSTASGGTYSLVKSLTTVSYINTGLTKNKYYYYKVRAYHLEGTTKVYSGFTVIKSAKPY